MISQDLILNIENDFNNYLTLFPMKSDEIKSIAKAISKELRVFFMKAITQMSATDIISVDLKDVLQHVTHTYKVTTSVEYCKKLPIDIVFNFILPYRVNDEDFTLYSTYFYKELEELINEKSIAKTAMEVNYWCFSKATYAQADDRTQNAMTTVRSGKGRCGEESVFLVSALRSIGIPARQCYSPYWSHCDDNHAWVEVFTGEKWEFMGACEPEEKLNIGWFNNAASRALVVRHRCFELGDRQTNNDQNKIFKTDISTSVYGKTKEVKVSVIYENSAIPNARVGLYIINYAMPKLVLEKTTDINGYTTFEVGIGDFLLFTWVDGNYAMKICSKTDRSVVLDLSQNVEKLEFNLVPYEGDISNIDFEQSPLHKDKMIKLFNKRIDLHKTANESQNKFIQLAALNKDEIEKFINNSFISEENKNEILSTLTKKDCTDITFDALCDMNLSYEYKNKYSKDIFNKYILPLRVENEAIYSYKKYVKEFFINRNITTPQEAFNYVNSNIKVLDDYTYVGLVGDIKGVLQNNIATTFSIPIHLVQIIRSLGVPARLNPIDRTVEYYDGVSFVSICDGKAKSSKINFINDTHKSPIYGDDFTVCKLDNGYFTYLNMSENLKKSDEVNISKGCYVITQSTRQIDGSVTGSLQFYLINEDETASVILNEPADNTKDKIKSINIEKSIVDEDGKIVLAYIENGSEPTEHFLNELLEKEKQIKRFGIKVILEGDTLERNNILSEVLDKGIATYTQSIFTKEWKQFRKDMGIGDLRLPFITAVLDKKGLFSFANYNVGTVDLLLKIFNRAN